MTEPNFQGEGEYSSLESMIFSAGSHVDVSPDLRPLAIESAIENQNVVSTRRRFGWSLVASVLLASMSVHLVRGASSSGGGFASPSSAEIQNMAVHHAAEANMSPDWALFEAFNELRHSHADLIRNLR